MTKEQKIEIAYQLRDIYNLSNPKIAQRLCVSHVTVGKWFKQDNSDNEQENDICYFFDKRIASVIKTRESIREFVAESSLKEKHDLEEAELGMCSLYEEALSLTIMLSEQIKALRASQQGIKDVNEACQSGTVEDQSTKLILDRVH